MEDSYIGSVFPWAVWFAPQNWHFCDGALLPLQQNTVLFAIMGTTYGGDGRTTFALPDLRGRVAVGAGQGPDKVYVQGAVGGQASVQLTLNNLPQHSHAVATQPKVTATMPASTAAGASTTPQAGNVLAAVNCAPGENPVSLYGPASTATVPASGVSVNLTGMAATVVPTGSGQAFAPTQPYLGLNHIICLSGTFPMRP